MSGDILIIDDEADIRELVSGILSDEGYETRVCSGSEEAIEKLQASLPDLVFLDVWLEGSKMDGLALLNHIKNKFPSLPVIMISGHGNIDTAVSAIKRGAYDFIEKPFNVDRLLLATERALETYTLRKQVYEIKKQKSEDLILIGDSAVMRRLRQDIEKVSPTSSRVMLWGPPGSGKERVARAIHVASSRSDKPFVIANLSSMEPGNIAAEIFGVEYPDGRSQVGLIEKANGGTLYIDEISDIPKDVQNLLLRWLTVNNFKRVSGVVDITSDVRLICSSSIKQSELLNSNKIREDLYHRIAVVPLVIPALENRREDIPLLVDYFIDKISKKEGIKARSLSTDSLRLLQEYNWPGNIRQLRNNIERLLILACNGNEDEEINANMLPPEICDPLAQDIEDNKESMMSLPLREAREFFEKKYLISKIEMFNGNISKTAENIGMERSALHRKLKLLNICYKE